MHASLDRTGGSVMDAFTNCWTLFIHGFCRVCASSRYSGSSGNSCSIVSYSVIK